MQRDLQRVGGLPGGGHSAFVRGGEADHRALHGKALLLQNAHRYAGIDAAAQPDKDLILFFKGVKAFHSFLLFGGQACRPPYRLLCSTAKRSQRSFSGWPAWPLSQW